MTRRLERLVQKCHEWSLRRLARRVLARLKRSVKRRMRGERHRQWMERNLHDSEAGVVLDITQSAVNVMMVGTIIDQNWTKSASNHKAWYLVFDIANLLSIFVNFTFRLYAASNRKGFFLHWLSLIDIATVVPLFMFAMNVSVDAMSNRYLYRFALMVRTIRILQIFRLLRLAKSARVRQGLLIGFTILCIVICGAITFQTIEFCDPGFEGVMIPSVTCQNLSFLDSIYFVCITIGTVGFGDFVPTTRVGKLADILLIVIAGVAIPTQIGGYTDILSRETALDKRYEPNKSIQHILLCGEIDNGALRFFLHSWLNMEGERGNRKKVVILAPTLPSNNLRRVLIEREYEQRVVYLQGSAMVTADLLRAGAPSAAYCFVLVKKHSSTLDQNDTAANLLTCSVRRNNRVAPLYVQVSKYDNARHVNISGASAVVCLEQLRLAIFGKSLWIKGFNAFLGNLIERFIINEEGGDFWLSDYLSGCSHRIFEVCLPTCLNAMPTFASLAALIYREFSVPIIGLRTFEETAVLFPVSDKLTGVNFLSIFIIAKSKEVALKIGKMSSSVLSRHADLLPKSADGGGRTPGGSRTGFIISAMEGKFPFRGRGGGDDNRSVKSARGPMAQSARSINSNGRQTSRSDKITPLASEDDYGDCAVSVQEPRGSNHASLKTKHHVSVINFSTLNEPGRGTTEDEDADEFMNEQTPSVVALASAKKATSLTVPPSIHLPWSVRSPTSRLSRSPRSHRDVYSPRCESSESPVEDSPTRTTSGVQVTLGSKRSLLSTDASTLDSGQSTSVVAVSYHTNTNGNGLPIDAAAARYLSSEHLGSPSPKSAQVPDEDDTENTSSMREMPSVRRRSAELRDLRLRRSSVLRSFRRTPPPANLEGHFVVCGTPSNYADFVANLSDLDERVAPVVFVTPKDLGEKEYEAYTMYADLYFVRGSPVSMRVFHEARMPFARSILIMSYCASESGLEAAESELEQADENMADVDAITTHRFINNACQSVIQHSQRSPMPTELTPFVVIEMIKPSNCKFLADRSDSLYDDKSVENELRTREQLRDVRGIDDCLFSPLYASGHIHFPNIMDALLGSCSQHTLLIEMVTRLVTSGNLSKQLPDRDSNPTHRLSQVPAPPRFHYRPYAMLVEGMLKEENMMALGMYRTVSSHLSPAHVFTNPPPTELVRAHDLIFVIW